MSFVAVVTVIICIKRDHFVRTATVWAVGLPRLLRTFEFGDTTRVTVTLCSQRNTTAVAAKQWWPGCVGPAVAKRVGGGRGTRYPAPGRADTGSG